MRKRFTCRRGHQWESDVIEAANETLAFPSCPSCGAAAQPTLIDVVSFLEYARMDAGTPPSASVAGGTLSEPSLPISPLAPPGHGATESFVSESRSTQQARRAGLSVSPLIEYTRLRAELLQLAE